MTYNEIGGAPVQFDELADQLVEMGGGSHPSELHGLLCGMLAGGNQTSVQSWLKLVTEMLSDEPLDSHMEGVLTRLYINSLQQLGQSDFSMPLLLPDDEEGLEQRTEALGYWCQGFLSGFGEAAAGKSMSDETEGVINDFAEIAQIQAEDDDSDEAERFFMEVSEFVRMALIAVYSELNDASAEKAESSASKHKTVH